MPEIYERDSRATSDQTATHLTSTRVTPDEAANLISFALSQLSAKNAHHEFEHLCRHLTRRKICPNIIPATGPVSGGGDQGADFETYKVAATGQQSFAVCNFFSRAVTEKWLFACSLELKYKKKINEDLRAAKAFGQPVSRLVFFHHLPIKVAARNKLKKEAKDSQGLELEIFDGPAIAEMLADRQTSWIATRYLSLPGEFVVSPETPSPGWFEEVLAKTYDRERLTSADFFELKDAIRFATWQPEHHSDLAKLLEAIQIFKEHSFIGIRRKAVYETFVASLRGLQTTSGLDDSLREYFADVESLSEPVDVEDGAVLVGYALAARRDRLLDIPLSQLGGWHERLTARAKLLKNESTSPARRCSCLFVEGYLAFNGWLMADPQTPADAMAALRTGAQAAVKPWLELSRKAQESPLFPIERLARLVNDFLVPLEGINGIDQLVRKIDLLSLKRAGQEKVAEHHRDRAISLLKAGQNLRALDELHSAHTGSFLSGKGFQAAIVCSHLSKLYAEMGLYFAAKYYGLAATYASLSLPDERLPKFAHAGCAEAASADHASGGSLLYFLTARLFITLTSEYSMAGNEESRNKEWARINFYALLLAYGAGMVFEKLQRLIVEKMLPALGLSDMYVEAKPMLEEFFSKIPDSRALAAKATSQGIAPPFSDAGGMRKVAWRQLRTNWHLTWRTDYQTEQQAEALAAYLQIMLADFSKTELSIIPGDVFAGIEVHDGKIVVEDVSDNERVSRIVRLPRAVDESNPALPSVAEIVAMVLLRTISALPDKEFRQRCEAQFTAGLRSRLSVYRPSELLFADFYDPETYSQLYNVGRSSFDEMPDYVVETWEGLEGPQGTHPRYDKTESQTLVKNRYKNVAPVIRITLPRLIADSGFLQTVQKLRAEGWKDWHILMAIASIRFNYLLNVLPENQDAFEKDDRRALAAIQSRPEKESDPEIPLSYFTEEDLRRSLKLSQMSTLKGLGLDVPQQTPNLKGIERLLRRFHYWEDDVPHADFFPV